MLEDLILISFVSDGRDTRTTYRFRSLLKETIVPSFPLNCGCDTSPRIFTERICNIFSGFRAIVTLFELSLIKYLPVC